MKGLIFVYALTYGGAVAALVNPFVGLLIYVSFAILKPERLWQVPVGNYSKIVALALLVGWAISGFGGWRLGRARLSITALMFFWFWTVLSAAQAPNGEVAWGFVDQKSKIFLPVLVGITTIDSVKKLKQLAWVIVLSLGYVAFRENERYFQGLDIVRDNILCHMMVTGIAPSFFLGMQVADRRAKALAFLSAVLMLHVVMIQGSRGAMVGVILTGLGIFLVIPKRPQHYVAFLIAVLCVLRLAGPQVQERFATIFASEENRDASAQSRLDLWTDMADATAKHPVFGLGPDHWPLVAEQYGWPPGKEGHGLWTQIAAETGVPGVSALLLFYLLTVIQLLPYTRDRFPLADPDIQTFARGCVACLAGFVVEAQFGSFEGLESPYYIALLGAGALKVAGLPSSEESEAATASPSIRWSIG